MQAKCGNVDFGLVSTVILGVMSDRVFTHFKVYVLFGIVSVPQAP